MMTCLHISALQFAPLQLVKMLLERGADPRLISKEGTALQIVSRLQNFAVENEIKEFMMTHNLLMNEEIPSRGMNNNNDEEDVKLIKKLAYSMKDYYRGHSNSNDFIEKKLKNNNSNSTLDRPFITDRKRTKSSNEFYSSSEFNSPAPNINSKKPSSVSLNDPSRRLKS